MFVIEVFSEGNQNSWLKNMFFIPATDWRQPGSVVSVGSVSPVSGSNRIHMYDQRPAPRQADRCRRGRVRLRPDHPVPHRGSGVRGQKGTPESGLWLLGHQHCRRRNQSSFQLKLNWNWNLGWDFLKAKPIRRN